MRFGFEKAHYRQPQGRRDRDSHLVRQRRVLRGNGCPRVHLHGGHRREHDRRRHRRVLFKQRELRGCPRARIVDQLLPSRRELRELERDIDGRPARDGGLGAPEAGAAGRHRRSDPRLLHLDGTIRDRRQVWFRNQEADQRLRGARRWLTGSNLNRGACRHPKYREHNLLERGLVKCCLPTGVRSATSWPDRFNKYIWNDT